MFAGSARNSRAAFSTLKGSMSGNDIAKPLPSLSVDTTSTMYSTCMSPPPPLSLPINGLQANLIEDDEALTTLRSLTLTGMPATVRTCADARDGKTPRCCTCISS